MYHNRAAGAQLTQRVRSRHCVMADRVRTAHSAVAADTHLLLGEVAPTNKFAKDFRSFRIAISGKYEFTAVII
jgi:hypothetical protein